MSSPWNLQSIRIGTKFTVAGILLIIGIVAIAIAYYRTIVIDEESQRIGAETRAIADAASTLTQQLHEAQLAFTRARLTLSPAAINTLENNTRTFASQLEQLPRLLVSFPGGEALQERLTALDINHALAELAAIKYSTAPRKERV